LSKKTAGFTDTKSARDFLRDNPPDRNSCMKECDTSAEGSTCICAMAFPDFELSTEQVILLQRAHRENMGQPTQLVTCLIAAATAATLLVH